MKNLILLHKMITISIAPFLIIVFYSISYSAPTPAKRSNYNSTEDIKIELSSDPTYGTSIRAETDFNPNANASTANITVRVKKNGIEDPNLSDDVTLVILGFRFPGGSYVPIGQGYLHPLQGNRWIYRAFKEPKTEKHPVARDIVIGAKYKGRLLNKIIIGVATVFRWYVSGYHQHGPGYPYHEATNDDFNNAWKYAKWKYGISTDYLDSIAYSPSLTKYGETTLHFYPLQPVTYDTLLGLPAFSDENVCASTLGHENVHGNQPPPWTTGEKEVEAYNWEILHRSVTGLSQNEYDRAINCRNSYAGVPGASCGGG